MTLYFAQYNDGMLPEREKTFFETRKEALKIRNQEKEKTGDYPRVKSITVNNEHDLMRLMNRIACDGMIDAVWDISQGYQRWYIGNSE